MLGQLWTLVASEGFLDVKVCLFGPLHEAHGDPIGVMTSQKRLDISAFLTTMIRHTKPVLLGCFLSTIVSVLILTAALGVIEYNNKLHYLYDAVKIGMSRSALEKHVGRKPDYEVQYKSTIILGYSIMERGPNDTAFRTADKRPKLVGEYGDLEVLLDSFEVVIAIAYPAGETAQIETADGWVKGECIGDLPEEFFQSR